LEEFLLKKYNNQRGFTLVEISISIVLFSIIMTAFMSYFIFCVKNCTKQLEVLDDKENLRQALDYIERSIKFCNQEKFIYDETSKTLMGEDLEKNKVLIDLSGKINYEDHVLIYFYKHKKQLRRSINGEHNVLLGEIEDIHVTEIIKNKLLEIEISTENGLSGKTRLKINGEENFYEKAFNQ
jgi:prepilin-type N-terminal cleavage/methylation domain-containing protein